MGVFFQVDRQVEAFYGISFQEIHLAEPLRIVCVSLKK
jgi:hypothetical protein